jgi:hypothetical protein
MRVGAIALALTIALVGAGAQVALALPTDTADVTWATNGEVTAIAQTADMIFVGGTFTQVLENGGAGPAATARSNLAAFDPATGAPIEGWAPSVNGPVYSLALSPDGTRLYVGGVFTSVDGVARANVAALDAATGAVVTGWNPGASARVRTLGVANGRVYLGGTFGSIAGRPRGFLGAVDAVTGALDETWKPTADAKVRSLAISPDGTRVFAGGDFLTVTGAARRHAAALDATTGGVIAGWHPDPPDIVMALAATPTTVFGAEGGGANMLASWSAATGATNWTRRSDGDFQAVAVAGSVVYAGGHWLYYEGQLRPRLVALNAATGALLSNWNPKPNGNLAVLAMSTYGDTRLAIGGDFTQVANQTHRFYAQFTGAIGSTGETADIVPPTKPAGLTATATASDRVALDWSNSSDNVGVAGYTVLRDGAPISTTATSAFTDSTVRPATTYTYAVQAYDAAQNLSPVSDPATITTPPPPIVFTPTDDASIRSDSAATNFGSTTVLEADKKPARDALLRFAVSGLGGRRVVSAALRVHCVDGSSAGGAFRAAGSSWSEGTVTWNVAPAGGSLVGSLGTVSAGQWYQLDVTSLVSGDGVYSVRASSSAANAAGYASKEAGSGQAPQLVVTVE